VHASSPQTSSVSASAQLYGEIGASHRHAAVLSSDSQSNGSAEPQTSTHERRVHFPSSQSITASPSHQA
jgi:hypothetical protein